ncbi:hypothetical protein CC80DRAFT_589448 [Byssothecium circinans]|uniref:Uncharacterized protein n=1 Tax=Byssothecium circinans TaxID=147558 RepID=A0A6A5UBB4_9PLEO|nr:hypothetical protein CC80DRAFT_589448 [Byssothecium circinans]
MAGYGNRNAPNILPSDLTHEHSTTRFGRDDAHAYTGGHSMYGSGATGGAGFGNKSAPAPALGGDEAGALKVEGRRDSTLGKIMERAGHVMRNENLAGKGRERRKSSGFEGEGATEK